MPWLNYGNRGGGGGGGRGFNPRWIIALVIAGIGIVSFLSSRQRNPVTGKVQYVAMSVDQEKALGLEAAPQMAQQMGGVVDPRRDPDAALVSEVGQKLVTASDTSRSPYVGNFHFHLLNDDKMINAFALPGGQIFITRALFKRLENEAQLAGVLGHEIGHVINRHSAQQMSKGNLGRMLATAAGVGSGDSRVAMGAEMANQMFQLKYGRKDETESDTVGIDYMVDAGYDPRGMLGVMEILKEAAGRGRQPEWMMSHPLPENRLREIAQIIEKNYKPEQLARLTTGRPLSGAAGGEARPAGTRERERW
jgi:beta-barrel assembly-enhancing protease